MSITNGRIHEGQPSTKKEKPHAKAQRFFAWYRWMTKNKSAFPEESRLRLKMTSAKIEDVPFLEACESLERKRKI
jgi:hypothetical protein